MASNVENNHLILTIRVTREQKEAISAFFAHSEWDLDVISELLETSHQIGEITPNKEPGQQRCMETNVCSGGDGDDSDTAEDNHLCRHPEECTHCLCYPCVAHTNQAWLGRGQCAREGNNLVRKSKYKKFWKMLSDRGVWKDPRYLERKTLALHRQTDNDEAIVWIGSLRELMPSCVIEKVRSLYPNLPGVPYLGHKWY